MKKDKRKKWLASAAALAAIAALVGTFAWFTSKDEVKNSFEGAIAGNDIEIVEDFEEPKPWEPGKEVNKDVAVKNSGEYNSLIRVNLVESIKKLSEESLKGLFTSDGSVINDDDYVLPFSGSAEILGAFTTESKWATGATVPTITVKNDTYTLRVKEKTTTIDKKTKYEYLTYWESGTGADSKKLYAKTGGFVRAKDGTITPKQTPQVKYLAIEYDPTLSKTVKWAETNSIYQPAGISGNGTGVLKIKSAVDENIFIHFVNLSASPEENKWVYNNKDGNFYYIGVVKPEAQTAQLIDAVTLSSKADNTYSKVKFDLQVNADGIQAIKSAITSDQWIKGNNNTAISGALEALDDVVKE